MSTSSRIEGEIEERVDNLQINMHKIIRSNWKNKVQKNNQRKLEEIEEIGEIEGKHNKKFKLNHVKYNINKNKSKIMFGMKIKRNNRVIIRKNSRF